MNWTKIALVLVMVAAAASATKMCFSCRTDRNEARDAGCDDPFSGNNKVSCNKQCYKAVGERGGHKFTFRGCGFLVPNVDCAEGEGRQHGVNVKINCCDGDLCNGATTVKAAGAAILGFIAVWKFLF